jgi:hypothetical protein
MLCYQSPYPGFTTSHTDSILSAAHITLFLSHDVRSVRAVHDTEPYQSYASFNITLSDQPSSLLFFASCPVAQLAWPEAASIIDVGANKGQITRPSALMCCSALLLCCILSIICS